MPRVEPVSAQRVQPARQIRRTEEARTRAITITQRSEEARRASTRRAAEVLKQRRAQGPGSSLDVQA